MRLMTARGALFSFNCYVAAMFALGIAFWFELPNPWWAALTVYITSQPSNAALGPLWARAWYRLIGTGIGMAVSLLIIPNLLPAPELMVLALAVWLGLCVYASLLDKTPRSYGMTLAGYTPMLVALPLIADPTRLFETSLVRTEEIFIGVLCAAVVHTTIFPRRIDVVVRAKLDATLEVMRRWSVGALADRAPNGSELSALRDSAAVNLSELNALAKSIRFEVDAQRRSRRIFWALEWRLVSLAPLLTAVQDRIAALASIGPMPVKAVESLAAVRSWMDRPSHESADHDGDQLAARVRSAAPDLGKNSSWSDLLLASLLERLADTVEVWRETLRLSTHVSQPGLELDDDIRSLIKRQGTRPLHLDHGLALYSGACAAVTVLIVSALSMALGWSSGTAAVGIAAAGSAVFAFADDPTPFLRVFLKMTFLAIPISAAYVFAVLPLLDSFWMLAAALLPLLFATGLYLATSAYWLHAFAFALVSQTLIGVQASYQADLVTFGNIGVGATIGAGASLTVFALVRVVSAELGSMRLLRAAWTELAGLAAGRRIRTHRDWTSRMSDRQGLLISRLARAQGDECFRQVDVLRDMRVGRNVATLRAAASSMSASSRATVASALQTLARGFKGMTRSGCFGHAGQLLAAIDASMCALIDEPRGPDRTAALLATVGLRRNLFPQSVPFATRGTVA